MAKKKNPANLSFEASRPGDRIVSLSHSLLESPAWRDLEFRERVLYLEFKRRYWRKMENGKLIDSNQNEIHFTKKEQRHFYGNKDPKKEFKQDLQALVDHGFIVRSFCAGYTGKMNLFGLSDGWKTWQQQPP